MTHKEQRELLESEHALVTRTDTALMWFKASKRYGWWVKCTDGAYRMRGYVESLFPEDVPLEPEPLDSFYRKATLR